MMRPISQQSTRMSWPRIGTSMPSSRSTASAKACSWFIGAHIVETIEIGHRLQIGLGFDQLLGAAVQQADMRIDAVDHLAVELEHETQHAVRGRMLRPEVDVEVADGSLGHSTSQFVLAFSSPGST